MIKSNKNSYKDDDIIHLNIGGTKFTTYFQSLTQKINGEENFFITMLSGKFGIKEDEKENIFIDRDGTHFKFILNYLREQGAEDEIVLPEDPVILKELKKEFKYYQIPFPVVSLVNEDSWEKIAEWTGYKGEWELFYKVTRDGFRNEDFILMEQFTSQQKKFKFTEN
jgi:hypothetical protein